MDELRASSGGPVGKSPLPSPCGSERGLPDGLTDGHPPPRPGPRREGRFQVLPSHAAGDRVTADVLLVVSLSEVLSETRSPLLAAATRTATLAGALRAGGGPRLLAAGVRTLGPAGASRGLGTPGLLGARGGDQTVTPEEC